MRRYSLYIAWCFSCIATLTSLFYSEVLGHAPCHLCWYQRICLFPLPLLLFPILLFKAKGITRYLLPLPLTGIAISLYQTFFHPTCCIHDPIHPCLSIVTFSSMIVLFFLEKESHV